MRKMSKSFKPFIACAVLVMVLLSMVAFPKDAYGKPSSKRRVAIKSFNGYYLCAENGGGSELVANRDNIGDWETFWLINLGKGYVALQGNNGDYVSVYNDDTNVYVNNSELNKWNNFQLLNLENSKIALKTNSKKYICAENGGGGKVVADRKEIGDWENFEIIEISDEPSELNQCSLTAIPSNKSVSFTWTKPSSTKNIIGYNLYRATASGRQTSTPITDFPIEATSYTDENLEADITYYYIVRPVYNDQTLGSVSNEVAVKCTSNTDAIVLEVNNRYMLVNGRIKEIDPGNGTAMVMKNGRTFLPIRSVIEAMGGEVKWDDSSQKVSIYLNDNKIYLWIGSKTAKVNGKNRESDVAPYISESGRTMLPLRFIVENLGCEADWDGINNKVTIKVLENN
jgi:hypothetical protein